MPFLPNDSFSFVGMRARARVCLGTAITFRRSFSHFYAHYSRPRRRQLLRTALIKFSVRRIARNRSAPMEKCRRASARGKRCRIPLREAQRRIITCFARLVELTSIHFDYFEPRGWRVAGMACHSVRRLAGSGESSGIMCGSLETIIRCPSKSSPALHSPSRSALAASHRSDSMPSPSPADDTKCIISK